MAIYGSHLQFLLPKLMIRQRGHNLISRPIDRILIRFFMDHAARNGELGLLQLVDLKPFHSSLDAMNWAAFRGHFDVVKLLHIDQRMIKGNSEATGCSRDSMAYAAEHDHVEIVQYLFENCSEENDVKKALSVARCKNHEATLHYLLSVIQTYKSTSTRGKTIMKYDLCIG